MTDSLLAALFLGGGIFRLAEMACVRGGGGSVVTLWACARKTRGDGHPAAPK